MIVVCGALTLLIGYLNTRIGRYDKHGVPGFQMRVGAGMMAIGFVVFVINLLLVVASWVTP